ncbi:MAG: hypothetical protein K2W82_17940 [Candidatus Obscuribacterales bacterium]|nr:hypothetical protein [Candidatus Obscuribacterales bacterium]
MKIFVLGRSRTGKSPFAQQVARFFGAQHIMGSEWVRRQFTTDLPKSDRAGIVQAITAFSLEKLRQNPHSCLNFIAGKYDLNSFCVIEGLRNPFDFIHLFDYRHDFVVFLEHEDNGLTATGFEQGLDIIRLHLAYQQNLGLLKSERVISYRYRNFYDEPKNTPWKLLLSEDDRKQAEWCVPSLEHAITDFCLVGSKRAGIPEVTASPDGSRQNARHIHSDIQPFRCRIRLEYLYDMDPAYLGQFRNCTVFALSSYEGHVPTFKILLDDGTVFAYIPATALVHGTESKDPQLELCELVYHNCPSGNFCINSFAELQGPVNVFIKQKGLWLEGEYILTMDWYEGNDLLNLVALANGQYALLPFHKVKFKNGPREFSRFKKLRQIWTIPTPSGKNS